VASSSLQPSSSIFDRQCGKGLTVDSDARTDGIPLPNEL
jgi:hypothetical protein